MTPQMAAAFVSTIVVKHGYGVNHSSEGADPANS